MSNRRRFLRSLSVTTLAAASGSLLPAQETKPARKLRKAIMGGTLGFKGTLIEKYKAAKEAGYEGVEPSGGMNQHEVIDALGQSGLQAASVCCHTHWKQTLTHPVRRACRAFFRRCAMRKPTALIPFSSFPAPSAMT